MIIVCGWLKTAAKHRKTYLSACLPVIEAARAAPGCVDFHLAEDPLDEQRINVFEQWEDAESVDRFRQAGPDTELVEVILAAEVHQHEIASTITLT